MKRLENEANSAAKSASERQDILARVISDLESRNQHLQSAMGHMSTEFQVCCCPGIHTNLGNAHSRIAVRPCHVETECLYETYP